MVFTEKDKVRCFIAAGEFHIDGEMYVLTGSRLTDALNSKAKDFLVVTGAKVMSAASGEVLFEPSYLAVNRDSISVIFPIDS